MFRFRCILAIHSELFRELGHFSLPLLDQRTIRVVQRYINIHLCVGKDMTRL